MTSTTTPSSPPPLSLRAAAQPGISALVAYWRPFLLIQAVALALVLTYFYVPAVHAGCQTLARINTNGGVLAAVLSSALAGGILPEVAKVITRIDPRPLRERISETAFLLVYFFIVGAQVYYFYKLQSLLWGSGTDVLTTAKKVAFDQLVFTAFFSMPFSLVTFAFRRHGYSLAATRREVNLRWVAAKLPSLVIPAWAFWVPMTSMVYSLPTDLQFPLFTLALAAWSLLLVFLNRGH